MFFLEVLQARYGMGWTYRCCFCERIKKGRGEGEMAIFNFGFLLTQRSPRARRGPAIGEFKSGRVMTGLARRISIAVSGFAVERVKSGGEGSDCQEVAKETSFADV